MFSRPVTIAVRVSSASMKTLLGSSGAVAGSSVGGVPARSVVPLCTSARAQAQTHRRPCGKCVSCSCHTKGTGFPATAAARRAPTATPRRGQSTAPQTQPRFEPYADGRPAWIKDPTDPKGEAIKAANAVNADGKRWVEVEWADGSRDQFPYLWMRDNCTCAECFHPTTLSRRFLMSNLDVNIIAKDVQVDQDSRKLHVLWSDNHQAVYPFSWLEGRGFNDHTRQQRSKWMPRPHLYWGGEMQDKIPSDTFDNVMTDDMALYRWMNTMEKTGLFRLRGAPIEEGQLEKLGRRVAFLKPTHFGSLWEVITRSNPSNLQYTTATLGMHIDLTYYDYTPGVQMLHCMKQVSSEGGENQFVDGFHIAERMRIEQPENFKLLTEVLLDHYDLGEEISNDGQKFFKLQQQPVIRLDRDGKYDRITYNNMVRDNVMQVDVKKVNTLYRALKAFDDMLHDPESHIVYKLSPGDIICFHNYRVMHGRKGYVPQKAGDRHFQGAFIDWDEIYSRRRVLQMMYNINE